MAAKFFTGLPLDGPDPECIQGYGEQALAGQRTIPAPSQDHSRGSAKRAPVMVPLLSSVPITPPVHACAESPLAGFAPEPT